MLAATREVRVLEHASEVLRGARLGGGRKLSLNALLQNLPAHCDRPKGLSQTWSLLLEVPVL
jgi:hypothetical protein